MWRLHRVAVHVRVDPQVFASGYSTFGPKVVGRAENGGKIQARHTIAVAECAKMHVVVADVDDTMLSAEVFL